jgi:hypothetical protein
MGIDAARAFVGIDEFVGFLGAALIGKVVEIDGQERRPLADVGFPMIRV